MKLLKIALIALLFSCTHNLVDNKQAKRVELALKQGSALIKQGDYEKALNVGKKAFQISKQTGYPLGIAKAYHLIGNAYYHLGDYITAKKELEKARLEYVTVLDKNWTQVRSATEQLLARLCSDLAIIYDLLGDAERALFYYNKAVIMLEALDLKKELSIVFHNIAVSYLNQRDFSEALKYCQRAEKIQESYRFDDDLAVTVSTNGSILFWQGSLLLKANKLNEAREKFDAAMSLLSKAKIHQERHADQLYLSITYHNIGNIYYEKGLLEEALRSFEEAERLQINYPLLLARTYNSMALVHNRKKEYDTALNRIQSAIDLLSFNLRRVPNPIPDQSLAPDVMSLLLADKGRILYTKGNSNENRSLKIRDYNDALASYEASLAFKREFDTVDFSMLSVMFVEQDINIFDRLIDLAIELYKLTNNDTYLVKAMSYEHEREGITLARFYEQFEFRDKPELKEKLEKFRAKKRNVLYGALYDLITRPRDLNTSATLAQKFQSNVIHDVLAARAEFHGSITSWVALLKEENARKFLNGLNVSTDNVIIVYLLTSSKVYIIPITHGKLAFEEKEISRWELKNKIDRTMDLLKSCTNSSLSHLDWNRATDECQVALKELYKILIPVRIAKEQSTITFMPTQYLFYVPFHALIDERNSFLIQNKYVHYLSYHSASQLVEKNKNSMAKLYLTKEEYEEIFESVEDSVKQQMLCNPDLLLEYDFACRYCIDLSAVKETKNLNNRVKEMVDKMKDKYKSFIAFAPFEKELKYSSLEVQSISRFFTCPKIYVGTEAEESKMNRIGLQQFQVLHFATHSEIDPELNLKSGLLFSEKFNTGSMSDGRLNYEEILRLNLENNRLVTLSACETGKTVRHGEIYISLADWFIKAGSPAVIASLWEVHDQKTADLMVEFYRNLTTENYRNKMKALCDAQRSMIKNGVPVFYWAPFVLIGDPN